MSSLTFINKLWWKGFCVNCVCLRTRLIHSIGSTNTYARSLHVVSNRSLKSQINYPKNNNFVQTKYTSNLVLFNNNSIHVSSVHTLVQGYINVFHSVSESTAVTCTQKFLISVHDSTGLPWWATIAIATVLLRSSLTLPLALYQQYIMAKVENLNPEMSVIAKELQKEAEIGAYHYKWSPLKTNLIYRRAVKAHWRILVERENCHPAKAGIVVLFQLPMWILFSMSIRNLVSKRPLFDEVAEQVYDQMQHEGFFWIENLTVPDSTMIIPCTLCLVSLSIVEINRLMNINHQSRFKNLFIYTLRGFALISLPFGYIVPSCLSFYWLTSATVGLCQNLIVMSPRLKLLVGIPRTPTTLSNPYSFLWNQIVSILKLSGSSKI